MKKTAENTPDLLPDDVRFALIGGPYLAPEVRKGQHLLCEMRGMVEVGGWTDAPIPWPRVKKNRHTLAHTLRRSGSCRAAGKRHSRGALVGREPCAGVEVAKDAGR